eukprot:5563584-Amphidinium_carterae.1
MSVHQFVEYPQTWQQHMPRSSPRSFASQAHRNPQGENRLNAAHHGHARIDNKTRDESKQLSHRRPHSTLPFRSKADFLRCPTHGFITILIYHDTVWQRRLLLCGKGGVTVVQRSVMRRAVKK